jgi:tetraacyldisaccharide 4'-kinase
MSTAEIVFEQATARAVERFWQGAWGWRGHMLGAALAPAELCYRAAMGARNALYAHGVAVARAPLPVVSVGSLLVGGAGKTPFARAVLEHLRARGVAPALVHGGYAVDEPALHRHWNSDIIVIACGDRLRGANAAHEQGARVVVLDDGFQHRSLARDLDIVLVPADSWRAHPRMLPAGAWREPASALTRAGLVVVMQRGGAPDDADRAEAGVRAAAPDVPVIRASLLPSGWRLWRTGTPCVPSSGIAVAAIANPDAFLADAAAQSGDFESALIYRDHHDYDERDAERIRAVADGRPVLTTEKDAVKLSLLDSRLDLHVLEQRLVIERDADVLACALDAVIVG